MNWLSQTIAVTKVTLQSIPQLIPDLWIDHYDWYALVPPLGPGGWNLNLVLPPGIGFELLRWQAIMLGLSTTPANGIFSTSDAHDMWIR